MSTQEDKYFSPNILSMYNSVQLYCPVDRDMLKRALSLDPLDPSPDAYLDLLLEGSKADADWYCNRDFGVNIPGNVSRWVLRDAIAAYENPNPRVTFASVNGVGSETLTDDQLSRFAGLAGASLRCPISSSSGPGYPYPAP